MMNNKKEVINKETVKDTIKYEVSKNIKKLIY